MLNNAHISVVDLVVPYQHCLGAVSVTHFAHHLDWLLWCGLVHHTPYNIICMQQHQSGNGRQARITGNGRQARKLHNLDKVSAQPPFYIQLYNPTHRQYRVATFQRSGNTT